MLPVGSVTTNAPWGHRKGEGDDGGESRASWLDLKKKETQRKTHRNPMITRGAVDCVSSFVIVTTIKRGKIQFILVEFGLVCDSKTSVSR